MKQSGSLGEVDAGIWALSGEMRVAPGVIFPAKSHIIRLKSGALLIHSPIAMGEMEVAAIRELGDVSTILAPSLFHTSFLEKAHHCFPEAALLGPLGIDKKFPRLSFSELVGAGESRTLSHDFDHVFAAGAPKVNELVLRHHESNALLVADYFFNIHEVRGFMTKFVLKVVSDSYGKATQSKLWHKVTRDRAAAKKSAEEILALEFGRVLVCHGETIANGREVAKRSLKWLIL